MSKENGGASRQDRGRRGSRAALTAFCVALAAIMLGLVGYVAYWYLNLGRIRAEGERYAQLYAGTAAPTALPTEAIAANTEEPTPVVTAKPTVFSIKQTIVSTEIPTAAPLPTALPTPTPTSAPAAATAEPSAPPPVPSKAPAAPPGADMPIVEDVALPTPDAAMPIVEDVPIPTPDADTLVLALPTAPPVQPAFEPLLSLNAETVGFLDIEGMLSLPVVQRENDNDYYLSHGFEGQNAQEGALFLDGLNRLVPEDDCLIVYGHNMKNKTMFGRLSAYGDLSYLRQRPVVRFDTLYDSRSYVAFSAFTASMEPGNRTYFDVRNFIFDAAEFDKFVLKLQSRSLYSVPVDVRYGDRLLLLVTCDYTNREGRFILALRQVREDENEAELWAQVMQAREK